MGLSLAARQRSRRYRQRQKAGKIGQTVEVCEHQLAAALIASGRVTEAEALTRAASRDAT
jgi:hypothetical protein